MVDLQHIETFSLTCELGSLAAVARKQGISAAAVSKQLTRLEEELGAQLLIRTTRSIELTDMGKSYWLQCRRIMEEVDEAAALISQMKTIPHGTLKIVSSRYFGSTYIVPFIKEFISKYPKVELNLELAERIPDLISEGIDVLIGMSISATGDVIQKRIATTSYTLCASPAYFKKFGVPRKPNDLKKHRYITHSMRKPDHTLSFRDKETITVIPYIRLNDAQAMLRLALDGVGIVNLHDYVVKEYLERGELKEVLSDYQDDGVPIYVAYPQRRFVPSKVRCFIDFILTKIKGV